MTRKELQRLLEDILEIKFTKNPREYRRLAARLLKNHKGKNLIQTLNGFVMGNTLLIIKDGEAPCLNKLVLLDAHSRRGVQVENLRRVATPLR